MADMNIRAQRIKMERINRVVHTFISITKVAQATRFRMKVHFRPTASIRTTLIRSAATVEKLYRNDFYMFQIVHYCIEKRKRKQWNRTAKFPQCADDQRDIVVGGQLPAATLLHRLRHMLIDNRSYEKNTPRSRNLKAFMSKKFRFAFCFFSSEKEMKKILMKIFF